MTKTEKIKFVFKWIGVGAGIAVGFVALICAYLGITGGFKKQVIEPTDIAFSSEHNGYQADSKNPFFVIDADAFFQIATTPQDATELDATLQIKSGTELVKDILVLGMLESGESGYISATKVENKNSTYQIKMGEKFKLLLSDSVESSTNPVIELYAEHENTYCKANVFVDTLLKSYSLKYEKVGATSSTNKTLFPGDSIYVTIDTSTALPTASFNKSSLSNLTNIFKTTEFEVDNQDIAYIENIDTTENGVPRAKIKILTDGNFNVTAHVCNSFLNQSQILTDEQYSGLTTEEKQEYRTKLYGGLDDDGNEIAGFMIASNLELVSNSIQVGTITATSDILNLKLFSTTTFTADDLNININPVKIAGSPYTSSDLKYLLEKVEISGGYYVYNQQDASHIITLSDGTTKLVKQTDTYIKVAQSGSQALGTLSWVVTIDDYYSNSEPSNCLILCLTYEITSQDSEGNITTTTSETFYTCISVTITKNDIPDYKIKLDDNNSTQINLAYDKKLTEQTDVFDLSKTKLVLVDSGDNIILPETTLQNSTSPYKTTLFVTKQNVTDSTYTISNDYIQINNTLLGADENSIVPKGYGMAYLYSIVVKTNKDGKIVNSANVEITNVDDILSNCVVLYTSASITINVYQELEISTENVITLYLQEQTTFTELNDKNSQYDEYVIEKDKSNNIASFQLYIDKKVYIKLNVNDITAYKTACDNDKLQFVIDTDLLSLGTLESETVGGENTYLLPVTAIKINKDNPRTNLSIVQNGKVQYNLSITTLDYTLQGLDITSNVDDTDSAKVYLSLSGNTDQNFWTVDSGLSKETQLRVTISKNPGQATTTQEIDYKLYKLKDDSFDISTIDQLSQDIISQNFEESQEVMAIQEPILSDEKQNDVLAFNIKKAGKAILIASYTRDDDNVTIYSKPFQIEAVYPYFYEAEYQYGNQGYYQEVGGEKYRIITSSYSDQKTNMLFFIGKETSGEESVEGKKMGLDWKYSNSPDIPTTALYAGLYTFEVESVTGSQKITKDDFSFVQDTSSTQVINYFITPKVDTEVYVKIKVSTPFGYEFANTYNYVLVPDYTISGEKQVDMNYNSSVELFKISFNQLSGEFENDGGVLFITNDLTNSNYSQTNTSHITGYESEVTTIIYLPQDYDLSAFDDMKISQSEDGTISTYQYNDKIFEIRTILTISAEDGGLYITNVNVGTLSLGEADGDIKIKVSIIISTQDSQENVTSITINGTSQNN